MGDSYAELEAERDRKRAELVAEGFDLSNTFETQEGAIFDMKYATCPRCHGKCTLANHKPGRNDMGANFLCPHCELLFDEPIFDPAEVAYMAYVGEDDD